MLLVVVRAASADRVSEGLRAGLGLGLRGDPVEVLLVGPAARFAEGAADPRIARALGTLRHLGRPARVASWEEATEAARRARAVEVWTEPGDALRRILMYRSGRAIEIASGSVDSRQLAEQVFGADGVLVF